VARAKRKPKGSTTRTKHPAGEQPRALAPAAERQVFVLGDMTAPALRDTLEVAHDPPRVTVPGPEGAVSQGRVFQEAVAKPIRDADVVVACVDLPNCNVGFEIGYALGNGKPVALACARAEKTPWLDATPMRGHLVEAALDIDKLLRVMSADHWVQPPEAPDPGEQTLLLCPRESVGLSYAKILAAYAWKEFALAPNTDLAEALAGVGRVVWVIAPYAPGSDERDGTQNTAGVGGEAASARGHGSCARGTRRRRRSVRNVIR
jgi:hypothetical protein